MLATYQQQCSDHSLPDHNIKLTFFTFLKRLRCSCAVSTWFFPSFLSVQRFVCPTSSDARAASASSWSSSVTPSRIASTALTSSCVVRCFFSTFRCCVQGCSTPQCRALVFAQQCSFSEEYFKGPLELSLGKPDLTVLSTLELAELLLSLKWLLKMCSPIHCNNRAKLGANYVEELTCNEQVSIRDHKPVSYSAGVKKIYREMLIFLGKM